MIRLCLALLLILNINAPHALAQENPENSTLELSETRPAILDVVYNDIEGLGLYTRMHDGSLGQSLWQNTKRSAITPLLKAMPASSKSPTMQRLIFGVLLTDTDTSLLKDDIKPEAGEDLLTLRMNKLIEGGAYKQAYALYSKLENEVYHEHLARAGVLAMLYSGEKSIACLEANTLQSRFSDLDFWRDLSAYCDISLSETPDAATLETLKTSKRTALQGIVTQDDYKFAYSPEGFAGLNPLERAIIAAEQKLDLSGLSDDIISTIPAADLNIILGHESLAETTRARLHDEAVKWGLRPPAALPEDIPENVSTQDIYSAFTAALRDHKNIPDIWIEAIEKLNPADIDKNIYAQLSAAAYISQHFSDRSDNEYNALQDIIKESDSDTQRALYNIIENVDKVGKNNDNAAKAYEKHYILTEGHEYIMPSDVVWDRLRKASQADAMAETVLLNIALFSNQAMQDIYPKLFRDAMQSVEDVNLKDFSRDMAVEAALGDK